MVDSEEEGTGTDNDSTVLRSNRLMQKEMSNLASRAVQLQMSLEEYQQGLGESTNLLEQAKKREEEMLVKHRVELKAAADQMNELHDLETNRVLAAYRQQARYRKDYMSACLKFITRMSANLINSIIDPETKIIEGIKTGKKLET